MQRIVLARRKGRDWYIGAMTSEQGRELSLPLRFLGTHHFEATIWQDGPTAATVTKTKRIVSGADPLTLTLAPSGGAAAHLRALD